MSIENTTVESVMTRDVKTARENQSIKSIAKIMIDNGIGSVVIVGNNHDGKPVGIITERDLVREMASSHSASTAGNSMSKPIITIEARSSLKDALQTMIAHDIRRLPVVEKDKMIGIITDKDIFRAITKSQALIANVLSERLVLEYRPMYEQLADFMQHELLFPTGSK